MKTATETQVVPVATRPSSRGRHLAGRLFNEKRAASVGYDCAALPIRNDIAMTGEITIMGKVLAIGGVLPKLQAAIDAGCTEVIMPKENERDVQMTPDYVKNKIKVRLVSTIDEVLSAALVPAS